MMIRNDPNGPKTHRLSVAHPGVYSLHLRAVQSTVRQPRHRLVYVVNDQTVVVLRVLHDRMDLNSALR